MKLALLIALALSLSGCTTFLMKNCEQQGDSQYWHCKQAFTRF